MNQALPDLLPLAKRAYHWRGLHEVRSRANYVKDMHKFPVHLVQDIANVVRENVHESF
jgi:hypothetical protein